MGFVGGLKVAALGCWLGYLIGSVVGVYVIATRGRGEAGTRIAFGPFLGAGLVLALGYYTPIITAYLGLLSR